MPTTANVPKKKRGPTQVKIIPEHNYQKMDLEFNEYGQVVGHNLDKFASIIGAMVREHVLVVNKDWHSVDGKKKMEFWTFIHVLLLNYLLRLLCLGMGVGWVGSIFFST